MAGVWDLLGLYWGIIGLLFFRLCDQEGPRDGQEVSGAPFWKDLGWFGKGFGRVLDVKTDIFVAISAHVAQDGLRQHNLA